MRQNSDLIRQATALHDARSAVVRAIRGSKIDAPPSFTRAWNKLMRDVAAARKRRAARQRRQALKTQRDELARREREKRHQAGVKGHATRRALRDQMAEALDSPAPTPEQRALRDQVTLDGATPAQVFNYRRL